MKRLLAALLVIAMAFALVACGSKASTTPAVGTETQASASEAKADPIVLKIANSNSTAMWEDEELNLMAAEKYFIEQLPIRTEGRYEAKIYLDAQLAGSTKEEVQGLKSGAFDIVELGCGSLSEFTNAFSEVSVPYMYKNEEVANAILDGQIGKDMMERAKNDIGGIVPLFYEANGFRELTHANKVIKTPDDLKGVKIRVQPDEIMIATFEALGGSVVSVDYAELFTALQQHLVDAQENPATNLYNAKLYEVQKTCTITNHMFTALCYCMNENVFNNMSEADQKAVMELSAECQQIRADKMKEATEKYIEMLTAEGLEFYQPTDDELKLFSDAMKDKVWPMCEEIMGAERWNALQAAVAEAEKNQ